MKTIPTLLLWLTLNACAAVVAISGARVIFSLAQ
jgi:hypothetical protein